MKEKKNNLKGMAKGELEQERKQIIDAYDAGVYGILTNDTGEIILVFPDTRPFILLES